MEVKDLINASTLEAFETFYRAVKVANTKTLGIATKKICEKLESEYFYLESEQKKAKFKEELKLAQQKIDDECRIIITEWFNEFVL